jgi:ADP-dependent NAD(P)H-hydrate dehydratase / NAD(P)H-hydrate epimerase
MPMREILTPAQHAIADAHAGAGFHALVTAAGRAVARAIRARYRPCRVAVLCGPGNNGADGRMAASFLAAWGWPISFAHADAARADLTIDAFLGAGLNRDLPESMAAPLRAARRVVAIDVPSGLDGATGQPRGDVRAAELTVTFLRLKPGHLLLPGRALCGEIHLADIGHAPAAVAAANPTVFLNALDASDLPAPTATSHKYARGTVTILAGHLPGAAQLAAMAARRAGAGLVGLLGAPLPEPGILLDQHLDPILADPRRQVFVCGAGGGGEFAPKLIAAGKRVVADADALAHDVTGAAIITPHEAEFARAFGPIGPNHLATHRLEAARAAAAKTGAVVILKGHATIIAAPDGRVAINANAPAWLATGGTGDVLAGLAAGLLAQGMPAWDAARAAVFLHGRAAQRAGPRLIAEDLLAQIRPACLDPGQPM